jgi:hypothetical protein
MRHHSSIVAIRSRSLHVNTSLGEVERRLGAAAVAVLNHDGDALAALSLVGRTTAIGAAGEAKLGAGSARRPKRCRPRYRTGCGLAGVTPEGFGKCVSM